MAGEPDFQREPIQDCLSAGAREANRDCISVIGVAEALPDIVELLDELSPEAIELDEEVALSLGGCGIWFAYWLSSESSEPTNCSISVPVVVVALAVVVVALAVVELVEADEAEPSLGGGGGIWLVPWESRDSSEAISDCASLVDIPDESAVVAVDVAVFEDVPLVAELSLVVELSPAVVVASVDVELVPLGGGPLGGGPGGGGGAPAIVPEESDDALPDPFEEESCAMKAAIAAPTCDEAAVVSIVGVVVVPDVVVVSAEDVVEVPLVLAVSEFR